MRSCLNRLIRIFKRRRASMKIARRDFAKSAIFGGARTRRSAASCDVSWPIQRKNEYPADAPFTGN